MITFLMKMVGKDDGPRQSIVRGIAFALSEIPLLVAFGALALITMTWVDAGQPIAVGFNDIRAALILAASFGILSGYFVSFVVLVTLYSHRLSWLKRATLNVSLFLVHLAVFWILIGDGSLSGGDFGLIALSLASVVLAETTASFLWGQLAGSSRRTP